MILKLRNVGHVVIVDIRGKATRGRGDAKLRPRLIELLRRDLRHILVNLENTTHVDSCNLSELVACYKRARERNGMIKLLCPAGRVRDLLRVTRLDKVFEIFSDEDSALASFHCGSAENEDRAMPLLARPAPSLT